VNDCIIIPLKKLSLIKSRLSSYLSLQERIELTRLMLKDILNSCLISNYSKIFIVSQQEINWFKDEKIEILINENELNTALSETIAKLKDRNFKSFLIIPADIPLIETKDLEEMKKLMTNYDILISPSFDSGTNALFMKSEKEIELEYGEGKKSFLLHIRNALDKGLSLCIFSNERISFDVDDIIRLRYLAHLNINKESILYVKKLYEKNRNLWDRRNS